jgi:predicted AAA+ superfamily ATPase
MQLKSTIRNVLEGEIIEKCNTCVFYADCNHRILSDKFILHCPDYQPDELEETQHPTEGVKGLCSNCSKALYCRLPRPFSGVWHCEEYE